MARIFIDGFENGSTSVWEIDTGVTCSGTYKYTGNYGIACNTKTIKKTITSGSTFYLSGRWNFNVGSNPGALFAFYEGATNHVSLIFYNYQLVARRNNSDLANSGAYTFAYSTWYRIEAYVYIANSGGRFVVKVNGVTVIDFTGDTQNAGTGVANAFWVGHDGFSSSYHYVDDIVLDDADWIGDTSIVGLPPNGAGTYAQWDASTGANDTCVDEVPPVDTDYVSTNVNDEIDTYALTDMSVSPYSIKSVQVCARARKEGASTPQNIALVVRPPTGGTDYASADQPLTTSFKGHTNLWETNPYTAAAWTESEVNGLEAGMKSRA